MLKKLLLTFKIILLYFSTTVFLKADLIEPNKLIKPKEVIQIQLSGLMKNEIPIYEMISGAALAVAALLLILPGFATDALGILLIFPLTRKIFIKFFSKNYHKKKNNFEDKNFIDGEYKDIDDEK